MMTSGKLASIFSILSVPFFFLVGIFLLNKVNTAPIGDFGNYYYASQFLLEGRFSPDIYEPFLFNEMVNERAPEPVFLNYTPVPPVSVLFYLPIAMIAPITSAKWLFSFLGLLLFTLVYYRIVRELEIGNQPLLWLLPLVFYTPLLK